MSDELENYGNDYKKLNETTSYYARNAFRYFGDEENRCFEKKRRSC